MKNNDKPIANPLIVFREEFDDWAVLFHPDTGESYGLNPVGIVILKKLDGQHTTESIIAEVCKSCEETPVDVGNHVEKFIQELVKNGLVGYELREI